MHVSAVPASENFTRCFGVLPAEGLSHTTIICSLEPHKGISEFVVALDPSIENRKHCNPTETGQKTRQTPVQTLATHVGIHVIHALCVCAIEYVVSLAGTQTCNQLHRHVPRHCLFWVGVKLTHVIGAFCLQRKQKQQKGEVSV